MRFPNLAVAVVEGPHKNRPIVFVNTPSSEKLAFCCRQSK
jgi:hypothetical protein